MRRELKDLPTLRDAGETTAPVERASKRRRSSGSDESRRTRKFVRPAEPLYYHGKNLKELEEFLTFWMIHWRADPGESDENRVNLATRYLRGTPMKLWGQRLQSEMDPIQKWDDFKQWLRDSLKAPNQRTLESTLAIKEMRQREGQTCKDLYIYMCELENNIPTMTDDQRRAWSLINALRPDLRSRVVRDLQTIDSVEAVIACAGRNESTATEKPMSKGVRVTTAPSSESKGGSTLPIRRRFDSKQRFKPGDKGSGLKGSNSQATRERAPTVRPRGCWACGEEGHKSSDCPKGNESKNG